MRQKVKRKVTKLLGVVGVLALTASIGTSTLFANAAFNSEDFVADGHKYKGQPVLLTEFGGLAFAKEQKGSAWGYGNGVKDNNEFYERLKQLIDGISLTEFQGYCYTQLTDVQQEINGLLYADHTPKVDINRLKEIFERYDK